VKSRIFENFGMKVSAVLLSVFLWFFVTSRGQSEISLEAPIEFKDIPVELGIVSSSAKSVTLTVRGQERFMKNLNTADVRVFLDLSRTKQGEGIFHVNKEDVKLPFTMTVTSVSPSAIKVRLEEMISKNVPVAPQVIGSPAKGGVVSLSVEPKTVSIRGLRSEIRKVDLLKTEVFDISDMKESATEELELDTSGTNIKPEVSKVKVQITLTEKKK
jgi:YbbR domain-containing protein